MKTIIAGSRKITDYKVLLQGIEACPFSISHVISGNAHGVDQLGLRYAHEQKLSSETHDPDWKRWGREGALRRNVHMAEETGAQALLAIWDGKSRGTKHMIETATDRGLKVFVYNTTERNDNEN